MGSRGGTRKAAIRQNPAAREATHAAPSERVAVARILRPWGRRGEVIAELLTDFPSRFASLSRVFVEGHSAPVTLESARLHQGRVVLKFSGVDSISEAERFRGLGVLISRRDRMPLPAHGYYWSDLCGCRVVRETTQGEETVGIVEDIEPTGGVDLLRVKVPEGRALIPLAQDICVLIDVDARKIVIQPPDGLLELSS